MESTKEHAKVLAKEHVKEVEMVPCKEEPVTEQAILLMFMKQMTSKVAE
jgi:hypothetical protein